MAYDFYAGSTFNFTGSLQLVGPTVAGTSGVNGNQPDFSQVTVTAGMYDQTGETLLSAITVLNLAMLSNPETNGLFTLNANAATTATWPPGKAQFILQIIMQDGSKLISDPIWFRIKASPIAQGGQQ
ncbi:hypothetical protein AB4Y36_03570 [Paraburkholderia sp. BR10936]|uniref:hypothetical protein n=1 Tax=Paraburkholderia sp. BR10936 TaxID=3236993 RepID=UPI0034D20516